MNRESHNYLTTLIQKEYGNIAGVVIVKDDETVYEKYFHRYRQGDAIHIASVTKSVVSMLIGIAIDLGLIKGVDEKVVGFFPDYRLKRGEKHLQGIALRDLLSMRASYKYNPYTKVYSSDDWTRSVLDLMGGKKSVVDFKYTTIGIHALSGVLARVSGMPVREFANEHLFGPLGIEAPCSVEIKGKDDYFSFLKDEFVNGWVVDPKGVNSAGWGLALTTRDLSKLGQLCLNGGMWNDQRVLSEEWIDQSTKEHSRWGERSYGYLWWVLEDSRTFAALGDGGNVIYVSREERLIVAITSKFMPRAKDRIEFIRKHVMTLDGFRGGR